MGGIQTGTTLGNTLIGKAYDTSGASYTTFFTLTAGNPPTMTFNTSLTPQFARLGLGAAADGTEILTVSSGADDKIVRFLQTGAFSALIDLQRTGGTASEWNLYLPGASTNFVIYSGADLFTFTTGGAFTATGGIAGTTGTFSDVLKTTSGALYAAHTYNGITVNSAGDNPNLITSVNSKIYTVTLGNSAKVVMVQLATGEGALVFCDYASSVITFLSPAGTNIVASTTPGATQIGISKSPGSHTVLFETGSAVTGAWGSWGIVSLGGAISAISVADS